MSSTKIQDTVIESLHASKLTGTFGAIDGSSLTNLPPSGEIIMKYTVDPAADTNPATGVGTLWLNTETGKMYVCTDATADANVWNSVSGSEEIGPVWAYQGTEYGYAVGGNNRVGGPQVFFDDISRFSFASHGPASDVGNLLTGNTGANGHKSIDKGWASSGYNGGLVSTIQNFTWDSQTNATDHGAVSLPNIMPSAGHSTDTYGYTSGGWHFTNSVNYDKWTKFPYASQTDSTAVADLNFSGGFYQHTGWSTDTDLYTAGGYDYGAPAGSRYISQIEKMQPASDNNSSVCGNMSAKSGYNSGNNSTTHGFVHGGYDGGGNYYLSRIEKFTFASEGTATNWSSLALPSYDHGCTQSTTHGYAIGGVEITWAWTMTEIYQYSYSSESNAVVDVGDLTRCMTGISDCIAK